MKKNPIYVLCLTIALVFALPASVRAEQEKTKVVKIGYMPTTLGISLYVAQAQGFFEKEGVQIEAVQFTSSNHIVDAVIRGDIEVGLRPPVPILISAELAEPGKMKIFEISSNSKNNAFDWLLVAKDSPLKHIADLHDKKIGVMPGSNTTMFLKKFLEQRGVATEKITFVQIPPGNQLAAFYSGSIDALYAFDPITTIALQSGNARKLYEGSIYVSFIEPSHSGASVLSSEFVAKYPELARKTVKVFDKTIDFVKSNDATTRGIMRERLKLDPKVADNMSINITLPSDKVKIKHLQKNIDLFAEMSGIKQKIDISKMLYLGR